jgi:hypothetical protein
VPPRQPLSQSPTVTRRRELNYKLPCQARNYSLAWRGSQCRSSGRAGTLQSSLGVAVRTVSFRRFVIKHRAQHRSGTGPAWHLQAAKACESCRTCGSSHYPSVSDTIVELSTKNNIPNSDLGCS